MEEGRRNKFIHPLASGDVFHIIKMLFEYGGFDIRYLINVMYSVFLATTFSIPKFIEKNKFSEILKMTRLNSPVYIIGHWRSGTTFLHNLMCCDPQFGYISTLHSASPSFFLLKKEWMKAFLRAKIPEKRFMDNIPVTIDAPQEEDFGMSALSWCSCYHFFFFPSEAEKIFRKTVLLEGISKRELEAWARTYMYFLTKVTYDMGGRALILKNPANTGRIRELIKIFPEAKFVHIYRNPYDVFYSTANLWKKMLAEWSLQNYDMDGIEKNILLFYRLLMKMYFEVKNLIPENNLVEVRYEELEERPVQVLQEIYERLNMLFTYGAKLAIKQYIRSIGNYKKNIHDYKAEVLKRVYDNWGFAIGKWGYTVPSNSELL